MLPRNAGMCAGWSCRRYLIGGLDQEADGPRYLGLSRLAWAICSLQRGRVYVTRFRRGSSVTYWLVVYSHFYQSMWSLTAICDDLV